MTAPGPVRAHLQLAHTHDAGRWRVRHAEGLVPDRLPYGLDHLERHGVELDVLDCTRSRAVQRLVGGAARRVSGGFELVDAARGHARRRADLAIAWDERAGVPAALRSGLHGEPPAALGVIWLTEPGSCLPFTGRALARRALGRAEAVWALSPPQLDVLRDEWGVPARRLHFLRFGIDERFWAPDGQEPEPGLVVGAGNDRHRDHDGLVDVLRRVVSRRPARLEIATERPLDLPAALGCRHHTLDHTEMRRLYGRASVVALALHDNRHVSGMSVATRTPGIEEYVRDGETGILVAPGDPNLFARAIRELLDDPERARALGRAGRAAVLERHTSAQQAEALAAILRSAA